MATPTRAESEILGGPATRGSGDDQSDNPQNNGHALADPHVVLDLLARRIATTVGCTYMPGGDRESVEAGPIPIFIKYFQAKPDTAILLTLYPLHVSPHDDQPVTQWRLQARARHPLDADPLSSQVINALVRPLAWWAGTSIQHVEHESTIPMGHDQVGRDEVSTNYTIHTI